MSIYHPDRWIVLELSDGNKTYKKVFSGNYGGYLGSDTWKLSSVIESIKEDDEGFIVLCQSGSTYMLHKQAYGMSNYMSMILSGWAEEANKPESTIKIEILKEYDTRK
jgi:hypothetical protein